MSLWSDQAAGDPHPSLLLHLSVQPSASQQANLEVIIPLGYGLPPAPARWLANATPRLSGIYAPSLTRGQFPVRVRCQRLSYRLCPPWAVGARQGSLKVSKQQKKKPPSKG